LDAMANPPNSMENVKESIENVPYGKTFNLRASKITMDIPPTAEDKNPDQHENRNDPDTPYRSIFRSPHTKNKSDSRYI